MTELQEVRTTSSVSGQIASKAQAAAALERATFMIGVLTGGGAQRVCTTLANGFVQRGIKVELVTLESDNAVFADDLDERVSTLNLGSRRVRYAAFALARYLRRARPSVVLVFDRQILALLVILRCVLRRRFGLVSRNINMLTLAAKWQRSFWHSVIVDRLIKWTYRSADHVVAQTEEMAKDLVSNYGLSRDNIQVIHNPVSPLIAATVPASAIRSPMGSKRYFLFVGKLEQQKGLPLLFDAFERVYSKCPGVNLVILGEGSLKQELKREVGVRKLEHAIHFKGFQRELVGWYRNALATVLTSHYEGMPNVLIESIALGTPVVAFDCPSGPADIIIDGKNGYLVPYPDTVAFADRLRIIAEFSPFVPSQVRATAERFREDRIVERYIEVIENVAKRDSWRVA